MKKVLHPLLIRLSRRKLLFTGIFILVLFIIFPVLFLILTNKQKADNINKIPESEEENNIDDKEIDIDKEPSPQEDPDLEAELLTYKNETLGIEFQYPNTWEIIEADGIGLKKGIYKWQIELDPYWGSDYGAQGYGTDPIINTETLAVGPYNVTFETRYVEFLKEMGDHRWAGTMSTFFGDGEKDDRIKYNYFQIYYSSLTSNDEYLPAMNSKDLQKHLEQMNEISKSLKFTKPIPTPPPTPVSTPALTDTSFQFNLIQEGYENPEKEDSAIVTGIMPKGAVIDNNPVNEENSTRYLTIIDTADFKLSLYVPYDDSSGPIEAYETVNKANIENLYRVSSTPAQYSDWQFAVSYSNDEFVDVDGVQHALVGIDIDELYFKAYCQTKLEEDIESCDEIMRSLKIEYTKR